MPANVFMRRIPEQIELGLVGADDDALSVDDVQTDGAVLEEVLQVRAFAADFFLHLPERGHILEAVDCALNPALPVLQCANVHQRCDTRSVRPFDDDFGITHG